MQEGNTNGSHVRQGPVIIGGLGGSGTRVIAEIVRQGGLEIGHNLNTSLDNLHFAFTIESVPESIAWPYPKIKNLLDVFVALQFGKPWHPKTVWTFIKTCSHRTSFLNPVGGALRRAAVLYLRSRKMRMDSRQPWGWKAPRTQLYLPALNTYFPGCRYVHVIRHGLDMAFSENLNQLFLYGAHFDISVSPGDPDIPKKQLEFWIRTNTDVMKFCTQSMQGRFHIVNYDELCADPERHIRALWDFCVLDGGEHAIKSLCETIAARSAGRYRAHDLSGFTSEQLKAVEALGFSIRS